MSDARTPTYDQLSALCAQMEAALETVKPSVMRYAPEASCREFEAALTAYRTLSPDQQWQRVPEKPSADVVQAAIDTFGIQPGFAAMERAIKAAFKRARGENGK